MGQPRRDQTAHSLPPPSSTGCCRSSSSQPHTIPYPSPTVPNITAPGGLSTPSRPTSPRTTLSAPANGLVDSGSPRYGSSYAPNEYVFSGGNNSPEPFWSYGASWGVSPTAAIPKSFPDGTSNTIIFSTRYMVCGPTTNQVTYTWGEECQGCGGCSRIGNGAQGTAMGFYSTALPQWKPTPANCQGCLLQGLQSNGIEVCMGDGSTRLVSSGVSANSWLYAVLPNDNMTFDSTW